MHTKDPEGGFFWGDLFYFYRHKPEPARPFGGFCVTCRVHAPTVGRNGQENPCHRSHKFFEEDLSDEQYCIRKLKHWCVSAPADVTKDDHSQFSKTYPKDERIPCEADLVKMRDKLIDPMPVTRLGSGHGVASGSAC